MMMKIMILKNIPIYQRYGRKKRLYQTLIDQLILQLEGGRYKNQYRSVLLKEDAKYTIVSYACCDMTISWQQTDSNSSPLTDWAHFPSFDEVTTTQTQQVADFSNFSTAVESNPIDSSLLSPANSSSVPPFTKSLDNECTKGMFGDETNMSSTGNEALAGPSEPTEKCNGIKAKTI